MIYTLTGIARSGKDTVAKMLAGQLDLPLYALAQPIKDIMCALFDWDDRHRDGSLKEVELLYSVSPDQVDKAAEVYDQYGLNDYEEFHDCWDKLVTLFNLEYRNGYYHCVISPRIAFQKFGTEWGRSVHSTLWLEIAPTTDVIITDVRFDNEAEFFKEFGGLVLEVIRSDNKVKVSEHSSENGISNNLVDSIIYNNSTLLDLEATVITGIEYGFQHGSYGYKNKPDVLVEV